MHSPAREPNDLEQFFVERANNGDIEGLVALYEANAKLVCRDGDEISGSDEIREFFARYLKDSPKLAQSDQADAIVSGNLALTSSRHSNGDVSAEIARRQPDGNWLWVVDQCALAKGS